MILKVIFLDMPCTFLNQELTLGAQGAFWHFSFYRARRETPKVVRMRGQWSSITTHSGLTWESLSIPSRSWPLCGDHHQLGYQTWAPCWCTAGRASMQSEKEAGDLSPVNSACAQTKHRESSCGPSPLWGLGWVSSVQLLITTLLSLENIIWKKAKKEKRNLKLWEKDCQSD